MKTSFLALSAAALLVASAVQAAPTPSQRFAVSAQAAAAAKLAEAGVDLRGQPLTVKAAVGGDRRLSSVKVVTSSGSRELDDQAAKALRNLKLADVPTEAVGRDLTLVLGGAPAQAFAGGRP